MGKPTLSQVNLVCSDVDASAAFYRRLGIDIPENGVWRTPSGTHMAKAAGGPATATHIQFDASSFAERWNPAWKGRIDLAGRVVLGFHVPKRADVDTIFNDMTTVGYRGLLEPHDAFWGVRYAILEDPDGIAVGLMSPASPNEKSPPPNL